MTGKATPDPEPLVHAALQQRIAKVLGPMLGDAVVMGNLLLTSQTRRKLQALDDLLPSHGLQHARLDAMIGPHPLSQFVIGRVEESLRPQAYEQGTKKLTTYEGYADPVAAARRLAEEFSGLPHHYIYSLPLTGIFRDVMEDNHALPFSKDVKICGGGDTLTGWLPLTTGDEALDNHILGGQLLGRRPASWDGAHLLINARGYNAENVENEGDQRVVETIKSFFGLYMAHNLVERRYSPSPRPGNLKVCVHRWEDGAYRLYRQFTLDEATSALIHELHFDELDGNFENARMKRALVTEMGEQVAKAFANTPDAERVRLAGRWLFDSYAGGNQLMSFLQAMVVLEILLGDKAASDKIGLGELLRNRCAYLLGKSVEQRDAIMAEFSRIYEVRSAIVHRGKSIIRATERPLFFKLRAYAQQVIRAELQLLPKSPDYAAGQPVDTDASEAQGVIAAIEADLRGMDIARAASAAP
ncbi:hypothetical protein GGC65_003419 [Sphingopyxis sp. OAS728]|uniref:HEPN domain-containing protein n=1 Tax=Sphingopyxis sp. OAS728 TaxID=2663823 RepID=UPI00178A50DA|nr:HEPN domain-containing protein [Sphingopyxis sp. OAS728]MBE1528963.1 hypothetical protein [Sphingopyxis sp. OAS728]